MKTLIISIIILIVSFTGTEISQFYIDTTLPLNECPVKTQVIPPPDGGRVKCISGCQSDIHQ